MLNNEALVTQRTLYQAKLTEICVYVLLESNVAIAMTFTNTSNVAFLTLQLTLAAKGISKYFTIIECPGLTTR